MQNMQKEEAREEVAKEGVAHEEAVEEGVAVEEEDHHIKNPHLERSVAEGAGCKRSEKRLNSVD